MQNKRNRYKIKKLTKCDCATCCCHHCDNIDIGRIDSSVNTAERTKKCTEAKLYSKDI